MAVSVTFQTPQDIAATPNPVRDFGLNDDGEITVVNNDFVVVAGAAAVPQGIRCRLRLLLGENAFDQTKGTDWLGQILVKNPNANVVRELIEEQILDTPDVTDAYVGSIDNLGDRQASAAAQVNTIYSTSPFAAQVSSS